MLPRFSPFVVDDSKLQLVFDLKSDDILTAEQKTSIDNVSSSITTQIHPLVDNPDFKTIINMLDNVDTSDNNDDDDKQRHKNPKTSEGGSKKRKTKKAKKRGNKRRYSRKP